ncbi:Serine protease Do-like HtrB [Thalassocella blandensis]|nr:Serine protease Do-like HtrB [Thalassocella blandensis]
MMLKRRFFGICAGFLLLAMHACSFNKPPTIAPFPVDSIVKIETYAGKKLTDASQIKPGEIALTTSRGFIVESDGHVLTSYTTLLDPNTEELATNIALTLHTPHHRQHIAQIVAVEPTLNFAVLKINSDSAFPTANIIDRDHIETNKTIYTLADFSPTNALLIKGKLEHLNAKECYQESMTSTMFEADIDLTDSLMGSPIFNANGKVLAMHTGYFPALGNDFHQDDEYLLPIFLAFNIYDSIKKRQSYISPWTGFSVRPLTDQERAIFPYKHLQGGIAIEYVWPNSPAEKLGIKVNDILVKFSFYPTPSPAEFQKWLYQHGVGAKVDLHILRHQTEQLKLPYTIEQRPDWAVPK